MQIDPHNVPADLDDQIPVSLRIAPNDGTPVTGWMRFGRHGRKEFRVFYGDGATVIVEQDKRYKELYGFSDDVLRCSAYMISNGPTRIITVGNVLCFEVVHGRQYEVGGFLWLARYIGMVS